ncbi:type I-G CRISPR-associated protein Csb2 [Rubinisphaera margarita]|uniref:type I-G CRISPR-associated protein Csb2 n=1 Tax=Rubinisphaera margarita TaxID=2909586 RepID=UPI001EE97FCA|nr:type I-U CRISPR-associated protein Csb2 [Rubinisphaera margarita]MCG6156316.1 type I-U CRISPR-associated protein Csb2 [Rubinisphaera margarita]
MLTIEFRFPTGKWHATPWGRQVNEGAVEWPPAPWRILRALIAVWHQKHHDVPEEAMRELISTLGMALPVYRLPLTSEGHTRHYMPIASHNRTKIFDTFIALSPESPVLVHWPDVTLPDSLRQLLTCLLESMSYLGRAESWVFATLADWSETADAKPLAEASVGPNQELVRLLAPAGLDGYQQWRSQYISDLKSRKLAEKQAHAISKGKSSETAKLTRKDIEQLESSVPVDLFDSLQRDTSDLRKAGWNRPPGSEWIPYVRNKKTEPPRITFRSSQLKPMTAARFAVAGAVRPRLTEALFLAERVRQALIKISDGAEVFIGRDTDSGHSAIAQGHQHAHIFCESNDDPQGRVTQVSLYADIPFDARAERALRALRRTWGRDGHDLQYVLIGLGNPEDFGGVDERKGESPIFAQAATWTSLTPFVPADRLRRQYRLDDPGEVIRCEKDLFRIIRKELSRRSWLQNHASKLTAVGLLPRSSRLGNSRAPVLKFRRERRSGGGRRGNASAFGLTLRFSELVSGPISLGYASHFGLGLFIPEIAVNSHSEEESSSVHSDS